MRHEYSGVEAEPPPEVVAKERGTEAATGSPKAGRSSVDEVLQRGPAGIVHLLGPGLITGASDDDPSGIGTYSQAGSQFGLGALWLAIFTFPLMIAVQEACARVALQTGVGLGTSLRRKLPDRPGGLVPSVSSSARTRSMSAPTSRSCGRREGRC